jgi:hypothetical protein
MGNVGTRQHVLRRYLIKMNNNSKIINVNSKNYEGVNA